jgi:hypothetical protein
MKALRVLPHARDEWIALPLFPFKAWVLIAFPFYLYFRSYAAAQHVRYGTGALVEAMIQGYMLSIPVLLLGALIQSIICKRGAAIRTALYALASIFLLFSIYRF